MRTTVDIEPRILKALRREARARNVAFKHLLNRLLHEGLTREPAPRSPYKVRTFDMGVPRYDLTKALALADELEDAERLRKMALEEARHAR